MIKYKENPFFLSDQDIEWVERTMQQMSEEEKIGQLFCLHGDSDDFGVLEEIIRKYNPGGMMYRPSESEKIYGIHKFIQDTSAIPMLLAANLESGGDGIGNEGTFYGRQIQVAASNNVDNAYRLGVIAGREGSAVGCNWSFAPVIDIDMNHSNPITNVRTFGSDENRVLAMAEAYMRGCHENDVAVSIKHFPGDGVDDRDQHLVASVNSLSVEEWNDTFGMVYKGMIEGGAKTVMAGHILQPALTRYISPEIKDEDIMPASLSPELLQGILRDKLNFNGMIVTDATSMVGFAAQGRRVDLIPKAIASGCDMILFARNLEEDYEAAISGVKNGIISRERLDEAVARILATKASLKLHTKKETNTLMPPKEGLRILKCEEHKKWAYELSDQSITLVKNKQGLIPLDVQKYKRALVIVLGDLVSASGKPAVSGMFMEELKAAGFEVEKFDEQEHKELFLTAASSEIREKYDVVFYFANIKTASNQTTVRINWKAPMGLDAPWFVNEVPTVFISIANPYHLQDVPMIKTYINAYTANEFNPKVLVEKIIGKSPFKGINPIDPYCGYWDAR
ncbi:glycoside hydrolase family 3 N-terminal domain-containing protein [Paenibacillus macerans]|uniref:beta-N-acetylhexosaminidase n=1 Tax=Paenibacillus macerans TaxID=44252 RepID=A0A090ZDP6_PAEMA|nr:glycoside hydrolase family 3 N-terminal domain-containing protein [Paenibacillus macerans]KFN08345.1 beta-N-acetylglucosaminidase/beta-glucosidase [Paenibacillus macerans]MBS5914165.1 glycoside hydrolase family 3 protein [Paenibacillus macerans]MCY7557171.1 glycoside hydrolase family 3 protein [Paenibacillus macerans]MEC0138180.1 glycoside hydrolase family 3 N-terminal domain-containing protein [Paenibacillus macerans]MEC0152435.1 glycoside hydrolase family 3 N-terminal domain-containing pr